MSLSFYRSQAAGSKVSSPGAASIREIKTKQRGQTTAPSTTEAPVSERGPFARL